MVLVALFKARRTLLIAAPLWNFCCMRGSAAASCDTVRWFLAASRPQSKIISARLKSSLVADIRPPTPRCAAVAGGNISSCVASALPHAFRTRSSAHQTLLYEVERRGGSS